MRTPDFWDRNGLSSRLLAPLGLAYGAVGRTRRRLIGGRSAPTPVVCVGNVVAGGAGKTPVALSIGGALARNGDRPHFLTRGYRGRLRGPVRVDPRRHGVGDVGDEALLLADVAPSWVARDRVAGACAAAAAGARIVVMDDGLQNPGLIKQSSLLVFDGGYGVGNGRLLPAGPLRESLDDALGRADAVVLLEPDRLGYGDELASRLPVLRARLRPSPQSCSLVGRRVLAFAGIARPAKFFNTLDELRCDVVAAHAFPDHHVYAERQVMKLVEHAAAQGATPVTTAKDAVRLPSEARAMVEILHVVVEWEDPAAIESLLTAAAAGEPPPRQWVSNTS